MKEKRCVQIIKSTPVGSQQYVGGEEAVFSLERAQDLVKQGFARFWDPRKGEVVSTQEQAKPLAAGADQVRRETAKASVKKK